MAELARSSYGRFVSHVSKQGIMLQNRSVRPATTRRMGAGPSLWATPVALTASQSAVRTGRPGVVTLASLAALWQFSYSRSASANTCRPV